MKAGLRIQDSLSGPAAGAAEPPQRLACMVALGSVLAERGVALARVLEGTGVAVSVFDSDENRLPYGLICDILGRAVALTGESAIGLRVGARHDHDVMGVAGLWMRNAPTLGAALAGFLELQASNTRAATSYLHRLGDDVILGYGAYDRTTHDYAQVYAMVMALGWNIVTRLTGGRCRPQEVLFSFREPPDLRPYHAHFKVPLRFSQPETGLVLRRADLALPVPDASAVDFSVLEARAAVLMPPSGQVWSDRTRRRLRHLVLIGKDSQTETAARLGLHPRTLSRYLWREGTTFRGLSDETRFGTACELLAATDMRVGDVALALGYASHAAFDAAFGRWAGLSPTEWRARHATIPALAGAPAAGIGAGGFIEIPA